MSANGWQEDQPPPVTTDQGRSVPGVPRRIAPYHPRPAAAFAPRSRVTAAADWKLWARAVDRRRKTLAPEGTSPPHLPRDFLARITRASFQLDGIEISERDIEAAVLPRAVPRGLGPRQGARVRAHTAILRRIEHLIRQCRVLSPGEVARWHMSLACGLPMARLDESAMSRLTNLCFRVGTPHHQPRLAMEEVARVYYELLEEPVFPSFNGVLARLLMSFHLGRCGLPPVIFDPARDRKPPPSPLPLATRLQELVLASLDWLARGVGV